MSSGKPGDAQADKPAAVFDPRRARESWDRASIARTPPLPPRLARVPAPVDPYPEARRVLDQVTRMARGQFRRHERALAPFLTEAADILARMQAASAPPAPPAPATIAEPGSAQNVSGSAKQAPSAEAEDIAALREQLQKVLDDLEDLFEVYAGIGLP